MVDFICCPDMLRIYCCYYETIVSHWSTYDNALRYGKELGAGDYRSGGGRMFIIEIFEPGRQPHHRPTAPLAAIRIDTS
jgi:hypothetical protein